MVQIVLTVYGNVYQPKCILNVTYREIVADFGPLQKLLTLLQGLNQFQVLFQGLVVLL